MATQLLERLIDPRTREGALELALDATAMAADQGDSATLAYITEQLAAALRSSWQTTRPTRLRSVSQQNRLTG